VLIKEARIDEAEPAADSRPRAAFGGFGVVATSRVRRGSDRPGRIEVAGQRGKSEIADYGPQPSASQAGGDRATRGDTEVIPKAPAGEVLCQQAPQRALLFHHGQGHLPDRHGNRHVRLCLTVIRAQKRTPGSGCFASRTTWR